MDRLQEEHAAKVAHKEDERTEKLNTVQQRLHGWLIRNVQFLTESQAEELIEIHKSFKKALQ